MLEESNDTEASNQPMEAQESANHLRVPSSSREDKLTAVEETRQIAEEEKVKEPEKEPAKTEGADVDEERSDDDHEILQGNVSDDEAITGGLASPNADTGYSINFLCIICSYLSHFILLTISLFLFNWERNQVIFK